MIIIIRFIRVFRVIRATMIIVTQFISAVRLLGLLELFCAEAKN
jgi:hypothetical protein